MRYLPLLAAALLLTATSLFAGEKSPVDVLTEVKGKTVQCKDGKLSAATPDLSKAKYIGVYFSAHWCPPCRAFTPKLVEFYNKAKAKNPDFDIIFVSSDRSEADMAKYMEEAKMPWLAIKFSQIRSTKLKQYCGNGIPHFVVLDPKGAIVADSVENGQYVGPTAPMNKLGELLGVK